ncbi:hypothetical protein SUDANB1_04366 [Streptomyces sp. enrichment culture]
MNKATRGLVLGTETTSDLRPDKRQDKTSDKPDDKRRDKQERHACGSSRCPVPAMAQVSGQPR